eukprot:3521383-Amphidinium_carterae.1
MAHNLLFFGRNAGAKLGVHHARWCSSVYFYMCFRSTCSVMDARLIPHSNADKYCSRTWAYT